MKVSLFPSHTTAGRSLVPALQASTGRIVLLDVSCNLLGAAAAPLAIAAIDRGAATAEAAPLKLVLANVGLDDTGAVLLAQAVQECGVSKRRLLLLDVFDNPLGDSGATALLEAVVTCSQKVPQQQQVQLLPVERLDLGCTDISDASACALFAVFRSAFPSLRALGLALTNLSLELLQQLKQHIGRQYASNGSSTGDVVIAEVPQCCSYFLDARGTVRRIPGGREGSHIT